jgi:hypothetical protein
MAGFYTISGTEPRERRRVKNAIAWKSVPMWIQDGPNPMMRMWAHTLSVVPRDEMTSANDAKAVAKVMVFPAKIVLGTVGGGDLATKLGERVIERALRRRPRWIVEVAALLLAQASLPLVALGVQYGYITSFWKLLSSFLAHLL